jgi:hypothetical protein
MCEVRFGSVLRFQLGVQKVPLLPITKMYVCIHACHVMTCVEVVNRFMFIRYLYFNH